MNWEIDQKHSNVGFTVKHMMVSRIHGRFQSYRAKIEIKENDLTRSHFWAEIDTASIDTHVPMRDDDLRSEHFFDSAHYPTMTFESTRIEALGGNRFSVVGDLTIRGITRPITLVGEYMGAPIKDPWGTLRTGITASGTLNRKDYGLVWNQALETGGVLVGDEVQIQLDLELMCVEAPVPTPA